MIEILERQELVIEKLLTFRGRINQEKINEILLDMNKYIEDQGAKCIGSTITATYAVDNENGKVIFDVELLIPINKLVLQNSIYIYKEKLKIVNAVKARYIGNPKFIQTAFDELNKYILECKYIPITVGYYQPINVGMNFADNTEINVYVGINPNIL